MAAGEPVPFGQQLRRLRETRGFTQAELAERAGISVKAVSALERGERQRPYPHTVRALAVALDLSEEEERSFLSGATSSRKVAARISDAATPGLPLPPTPIIGRDQELAELARLLDDGSARLITLTGPGGVGKTRLALQVASNAAHDRSRVAFVPLAPLNDPNLVLPSMAQTIGLSETGEVPLPAMLAAHLRDQDWLIVLDNAEHLLDVASELARLLAACPNLKLLVTSRAPLRIRAEHEYPVRPLDLPDMSRVPALEDVAHTSSVRLFEERARAAVPRFELTQANCAAVATICRRLDGLPLALELVAARLRVLSPTDLLARLEDVLPLLVGGSRDLPQRQQTMQAAINWSYELLGSAEQALFRRLSIFAGGWTLEAAEAVVAWGAISCPDVIDLLTGLVEQSLVVAETVSGEDTRYRMLEPIRQFAASQVDAAGERGELAHRHLEWCLALATRASQELRGPEQPRWLGRLEEEHDNLRAALTWAEHNASRAADGLKLATALWRFWATRGHLTEGRRWLDHALAAAGDVPDNLRADGLNAAGNLARDQGDYARSTELHKASLALRREIGDMHGVGLSLNNLGTILMDEGDFRQATQHYSEALSLFREHASDWEVAIALHNLGIALGNRGRYEQAAGLLEEALELWDRMGEAASRARSLDALGEITRDRGDLDRAARLHEESLALRREIGDTRGIAITLKNLGLIARHRGDYPAAVELFNESLELRKTVGDQTGTAYSFGALADIARHQGDIDRALRLYQDAVAVRRELGIREGFVGCFLGLAAIAGATGDPLRAARLLGASEALREAMDQAVAPIERADYDHTVATIQNGADSRIIAEAIKAGRAMTLDEAIAEALDGHDAT